MLLTLVRICFIMAILVATLALAIGYFDIVGNMDAQHKADNTFSGIMGFCLVLLISIVAITGDFFVRNKQITTISAGDFRLLSSLALGPLFSLAVAPVVSGYPSHKLPA